ncbi:unnamed protein product [Dovyalis caffra]|uniref:Uncharacterized protein n=1 Tax=Dovyalis caffra TaxID=77055 RepID=A0AAV1SS42_9ROSI|nr:unnamed protein product [Dovyalis caffra]
MSNSSDDIGSNDRTQAKLKSATTYQLCGFSIPTNDNKDSKHICVTNRRPRKPAMGLYQSGDFDNEVTGYHWVNQGI